MKPKQFLIFLLVSLFFLFWYGGIFSYFNLINEKLKTKNELRKVLLQINALNNFQIENYASKVTDLLKEDKQTSFFNFFKLENLIFQSKIFVPCPENDYYCLRFNFSEIISFCLGNDELVNCLQSKINQKYHQKILALKNRKNSLENQILSLQQKSKNIAFIVNPFILLGNFFNPYLIQSNFSDLPRELSTFPEQQNISQEKTLSISDVQYYEKIYSPQTNIDRKISKDKNNSKIRFNFTTQTLTTFEEKISTSSRSKISTTTTSIKIETATKTTSTLRTGGGGSSKIDICEDLKNKTFSELVISEIQFESNNQKDDEFIEIYNPNSEDVDLTCWALEKYAAKTSADSVPNLTALIPSSKFQGKIKSKSFFLITSSSTKYKYQGDLSYPESYSLANNNVLILRQPNGQISDLVGYGSEQNKIFQFESEPFLFDKLEGKTIQRKNFIDRDNNKKDFWLRPPSPENSSQSRLPRDDFLDLSEFQLAEVKVSAIKVEEDSKYLLSFYFREPKLNISSLNYFFDLLISASSDFFNFNLSNFGATTSFPQPQFNDNVVNFDREITHCPSTSTLYYFNFLLKDKLDNDNVSLPTITSSTLPEELCNFQEPTSTLSVKKILFSEVRIIEGVNNNDGEYIEIYNPNKFSIDLTGWSIKKINKNGEVQKTSIVASQKFKEVIIKPFSYLLLANKEFIVDNQIKTDITYPPSSAYGMTFNNGLMIVDNNNQIIDKICWGSVANYNNCLINPMVDKVFVRKAGKHSTEISMENEEKDYGNSFDSEVVNDNFLLMNSEPQNSNYQEIPPDYFTQEKLVIIEDKKIVLEFVSPYQKLGNANYEVRINDLNSEPLLSLNLPSVKPYGEKEKIEFNGCNFSLNNNDKILLILKENDKIKHYRELMVSDLNCDSMIMKIKDFFLLKLLSLQKFFSNFFS